MKILCRWWDETCEFVELLMNEWGYMTDSYKKMSVNMYIMNPSYLSMKYVIIYINIHEIHFFK